MILRLDRVASRGKMARDIAHEINNYLAILQGNLELIPLFLAKNDTEKLENKVRVMKDTVDRISHFTDGLTRFSDENSAFTKEDLNQLIENLIAFLKPQNKFDNIAICTNLSDDLPLIEIDSGQIQLLLVHLINNAAEAMPESSERNWIVVSSSYDESSKTAAIKVADGGPGIAEENIPKLFLKRFSTKRSGTGLGLITCNNIVDNHMGEISYHASDESKSIFAVSIPASRTDDKDEEPNREIDPGISISVTK
jgi:signal transduction histidine kinase